MPPPTKTMPTYDYRCPNCGVQVAIFKRLSDATIAEYCRDCGMLMVRIIGAPAVHGCADGPGTCTNELVFDRPDPAKEMQVAFRDMEDSGKLRDPAKMAAAQELLKAAKERPKEDVDYGRDGHPIDHEPKVEFVDD